MLSGYREDIEETRLYKPGEQGQGTPIHHHVIAPSPRARPDYIGYFREVGAQIARSRLIDDGKLIRPSHATSIAHYYVVDLPGIRKVLIETLCVI